MIILALNSYGFFFKIQTFIFFQTRLAINLGSRELPQKNRPSSGQLFLFKKSNQTKWTKYIFFNKIIN